MALLVGCIYAQMIYSDIVTAYQIAQLNLSHENNPTIPLKVSIVMRFSGLVSLWMIIFLFILTYFLVCEVPRYIRNTIYELSVFCIFIIDFVVFRFKKEYEPYFEQRIEDDKPTDQPVKQQLVMLKEPNDEWYSMLDTYRFSDI